MATDGIRRITVRFVICRSGAGGNSCHPLLFLINAMVAKVGIRQHVCTFARTTSWFWILTDQCWECFSCVKICPTQAIEVRGYADFVPLGSSVMPMLGTEDVMWTCKFRNGLIKRFKFPIRTTPEGTANAY